VAEVADLGLRFLGAFGVTKINMRFFLLTFFLSCCLQSAVFSAEQPSIIVSLADDLGYDEVSCCNSHSKIQTPHLDRLAQVGMKFTDAHTPSSLCTPTRYGLLTGRYADEIRCARWRHYWLRRSMASRSPMDALRA
jgi:hypothetical protein